MEYFSLRNSSSALQWHLDWSYTLAKKQSPEPDFFCWKVCNGIIGLFNILRLTITLRISQPREKGIQIHFGRLTFLKNGFLSHPTPWILTKNRPRFWVKSSSHILHGHSLSHNRECTDEDKLLPWTWFTHCILLSDTRLVTSSLFSYKIWEEHWHTITWSLPIKQSENMFVQYYQYLLHINWQWKYLWTSYPV